MLAFTILNNSRKNSNFIRFDSLNCEKIYTFGIIICSRISATRIYMKRVVNTIQALLLFVVIFIASQILSSILIGAFHISGDVGFMLSYLFSMGLVYLLTTLYERAEYGKVRLIRKSAKGFDPMAVFAGVLLLFAISIALWPLEELMPGDGRVFGDGVYTLITVVVISPIVEELIFRGRLYNLLSHTVSPFMSAVLSSVVFATIHLEPIIIIGGFLSGMLFSYMYLLKRSIILPIILHICNNTIAYGLHVISYGGKPLMEYIGSEHYYISIYICSLLLVLVFIAFMIKRFMKEKRAMQKREQ